jgi:hypothetical protein
LFYFNFAKSIFKSVVHILNVALISLFISLTFQIDARAESASIAFGTDGGGKPVWAWARRESQHVANSTALAMCNKQTANNDCVLNVVKAVARAAGGGRVGIAYSAISIDVTKKNALKQCGNSKCKLQWVESAPGFFAIAESEKDADGKSDFYLQYGNPNSDDADKLAIENCEEINRAKCHVSVSAAIEGRIKTTSPSQTTTAPEITGKNCRPRTANLRCTSQCVNGSCVVTYENGCKMHVDVQSHFDPFTNQWTYPSPGC